MFFFECSARVQRRHTQHSKPMNCNVNINQTTQQTNSCLAAGAASYGNGRELTFVHKQAEADSNLLVWKIWKKCKVSVMLQV